MRRVAFVSLALLCGPAFASDEGAPWDYDGGPGRADCSQCHFDGAPRRQGKELTLVGLPAAIAPNAVYELSLGLEFAALATAGFLLSAEMNGEAAGAFAANDGRTIARGAGLRSTKDGTRQDQPRAARWSFRWTAPAKIDGPVVFYVAANASNDDASPFGDQIFLSTFSAAPDR